MSDTISTEKLSAMLNADANIFEEDETEEQATEELDVYRGYKDNNVSVKNIIGNNNCYEGTSVLLVIDLIFKKFGEGQYCNCDFYYIKNYDLFCILSDKHKNILLQENLIDPVDIFKVRPSLTEFQISLKSVIFNSDENNGIESELICEYLSIIHELKCMLRCYDYEYNTNFSERLSSKDKNIIKYGLTNEYIVFDIKFNCNVFSAYCLTMKIKQFLLKNNKKHLADLIKVSPIADHRYIHHLTLVKDEDIHKPIRSKSKYASRGEMILADILQSYFPNKEFKKIRPKWLRNPDTKYPLELDFHCEEMDLAIEFNGSQHYEYTKIFHGNETNFEKHQWRDKIKEELCDKYGIKLIVIHQDEDIDEKLYKNILKK